MPSLNSPTKLLVRCALLAGLTQLGSLATAAGRPAAQSPRKRATVTAGNQTARPDAARRKRSRPADIGRALRQSKQLRRVKRPGAISRTRGRKRPLHRSSSRLQRTRQGRLVRGRLLSKQRSERLLRTILRAENRFYQPGVGYDGRTGMAFDGHPVDFETGQLKDGPRRLSAASKESLHVALLSKAIDGNRDAQALLSPDPDRPELGLERALEVMEKKISTYEKFDADYPGFGGFLPWYKIPQGSDRIEPIDDSWKNRVPSLDNGQLAWSLHVAARALGRAGQHRLAARYQQHLNLMRDNAIRIFYDPAARQFRTEAKLERGNKVAPEKNRYTNNQPDYLLDDAYEGLMFVHFADLFGNWSAVPGSDPNSVWDQPRRRPKNELVPLPDGSAQPITVVEGNTFSSHEDWSFFLPIRDVEIADRLYQNAQRYRTNASATQGLSGFPTASWGPVRKGSSGMDYRNAEGYQEVASDTLRKGKKFVAVYGTFPVVLTDRQIGATWLNHQLRHRGAFGPNGIGESYFDDGGHAPILTWDGKATIALSILGGLESEVRSALREEGLYDKFLQRVRQDYRLFDPEAIKGESIPFAGPPPRAPGERNPFSPRPEAEQATAP